MSIPHAAALNPSGAITVEAWVRRNNDSRCETIVSKGYNTAWWLGFCGERIRYYGSGLGSSLDGQTDIPAGIWTHIAVTYQAGAARRYCINGELDYVGPSNDSAPTGNSLPVQIGRDPDGCCTLDGRGELGQGAVLDAMLSVGTHQVTLEAIDAAGLSDGANLTVTIRWTPISPCRHQEILSINSALGNVQIPVTLTVPARRQTL